jgi:hypothetical protein
MLMSPMLAVAIGVTPLTPAIAVSQGQAGAARNHKRCDCADFRFPVPGGFNPVGRYTPASDLNTYFTRASSNFQRIFINMC